MADIILKVENAPQGVRYTLNEVRKDKAPPFFKLGASMDRNNSGFPAYPDLAGTMKSLSPGSHWLFWELLSSRNLDTNISKFIPSNPTETKKVQRAYKELAQKEIFLRSSRGHYLCNPAVLQPNIDKYKIIFLKWEDLKSKKRLP